MDYEVLPEFLNQSEQRVGGFLTAYQMVGGLAMILPGMLILQTSLWHAIWFFPLTGLVVVAVSPAEGTLRFNLWLLPLLASLPGLQPAIRNWKPFKSLGQRAQTTTPLYFSTGAEMMLSADVSSDF
jgi:hypothetical protein